MTPWLLFVLLVLTTYRLTRLVTEDTVTEPFRVWVVRKLGRPLPEPEVVEPGVVIEVPRQKGVAYLVSCPFCASPYLAVAVVGLTWVFQPLVLPGLWMAGVAGAVAAAYEWLPER
jgi:hypothetical protein